MTRLTNSPSGDRPGTPAWRRRWDSLTDRELYLACITVTVMIMWGFFSLQVRLFIGHFEPAFLFMPTMVGMVVGALIARVLTLQRSIRATNERLLDNQRRDMRYRLAMHACDFAIWDWKLAEDEIFVTQGGRNILGGTGSKEFVSTDWWRGWIHREDQDLMYRTMHAHIRGETSRYECEYRIRQETGEYLWVVDRAIATRDADGRAIRISGVIAEITERKITEIALLEAKNEAEQASRTKSEFLANMSHELRTPLNAIIGFSEILKTQIFGPIGNPHYVEDASDIWQSGRHLLDIINDILDLSRIESGKMSLTTERVDLHDCAGQTLRMVEEAAKARNIRFEIALDGAPQFVLGDPRAVRQILLNLLSNSVKFTPDGGLIHLAAVLDGAGQVCLSVRDTGIGMRPEDIPVALSPFRQIDSSLARKHDGTGLGLPLAKALTELQGGRFSIDSEPGTGTEIVIALPQAQRAAA